MTRKLTNISEEELVEKIYKVVSLLAKSFRFGYHEVEDMKQQGALFVLQNLDKYDEARPLENFIYTHVKNRFINFVRDNYRRNDSCKLCKQGEPTKHPDGKFCKSYINWNKRNIVKQNIVNTIDILHISDEGEKNTRIESTIHNDALIKELVEKVDTEIPMELRSTWLQMQQGATGIPKTKRREVEKFIRSIIENE